MDSVFPISGVFCGCGLNVIFLELLTNAHPSSGNLITFAQFLLIALEKFIFDRKFGIKKRYIPIKYYFNMVLLFASFSLINNFALKFNIPMPLHIIIRSGSLAANLILGSIILKKKYNKEKMCSTFLITLGIILFSIASSQNKFKYSVDSQNTFSETRIMVFGISLLIIALLMSTLTGLYQEKLYQKFGRGLSNEALFYSHALPLPAFILIYPDLLRSAQLYNSSVKIQIFKCEIAIMWLYLIANVVTQYLCVRSVFWMTTTFSSLTVTLILTLRKFVSLFISIFCFGSHFTIIHLLGTILVIFGTFLFYHDRFQKFISPIPILFRKVTPQFFTDKNKSHVN